MQLFITRHGETEENKLGILQGHMPGKLSSEGIAQAKFLGERLRNEQFDYIYASDLQRVVDTAREITCYHQQTPCIFTADLRERDFGEFQGKNKNDIQGESGLDIEPQNGESKIRFYARAKHIINSILMKHSDDSILLICHGGIGQAIIGQLLGKTYEEMNAMEKLGNTSLSAFSLTTDGSCQVLYYNSTAHLR